MNRKQRRALAAKQRSAIHKKTPFGRIAITEFHEMDGGISRVDYIHTGKGRTSRVLTDQLLNALLV